MTDTQNLLPVRMPTEVHAGAIYVYDDVIPPTLDIIGACDRAETPRGPFHWSRATHGDGVVSDFRSNEQMRISLARELPMETEHFQEMQNLDREIFQLIAPALQSYTEHFGFIIGSDEGWHLLRYNSGQEYKPHFDWHPVNQRVMSMVLYVNDDFEGGRTHFDHMGVTIQPKAGRMILFPANYAYRHVAMPVLSGRKYALVSWFREPEAM